MGLAILLWLLLARPWDRLATSTPASSSPVSSSAITNLLSRSGYGPGGSDVRVLWATPEYFRSTGQSGLAAQYGAGSNLVFLVWENLHSGDLPERLNLVLRADDAVTHMPTQVLVPANAVHHRYSVFIFPRLDAQGTPTVSDQTRSLELVLPPANDEGAQSVLHWALPIQYPIGTAQATFQFTWASILAVLGGMLASMWPCLFQLTAFFIPTLAGLNSQEASGNAAPRRRFQVVKAAFFFVLGFTLVYTAAGAAMGFAAQRLGDAAAFESWRRYIAVGGGIIIILLALRVAAKARAPLVCKMPVLSKMAHRKTAAKPWELMVAGLAFATGCMTCFGAALIVAMMVYVGLSASPAFGALVLFLFSLGMGIPLVIGAAAMAKVFPLLFRLEKLLPWMGLASSLLMVGFAVLLISGNYMAITAWLYRWLPVAAAR
ncbi:MAG: sulfite exporter TauE/SafE family protein [Chloroflexi bacterium]|nr:sulfite exporter TauE/SafE family protein [Chloroflexota bacterium]